MKFRDDAEKKQFLADVNRLDLLELNLGRSDLYELASERRKIARKISKSEESETMEYTKRFAKELSSILMWKKFARIIYSFLRGDSVDKPEILKAISSLRTHIYIELDYYRPMSKEIEFMTFFDYMIPRLFDLEKEIFISDRFTVKNVDKDMVEILKLIVDYSPTNTDRIYQNENTGDTLRD